MTARRFSPALVLALCLVNFFTDICGALGTAFTYQGQLIDSNEIADGLYDFQFKLYDDDPCGSRIGPNVVVDDVDIIEGHFTVELDFGDVFDGNAAWLEIGVRLGALEDPNLYTNLEPRHEITPTPYALYSKTSGSDGDWMISGNNMYSLPSGNIGIGISNPGNNNLYVNRPIAQYGANNTTIYGYRNGINGAENGGTGWGQSQIDAVIKGYSYWGNNFTAALAGYSYLDYPQSAGVIGANHSGAYRGMLGYKDINDKIWAGYFEGDVHSSGKVGIGTTSPSSPLEVNGKIESKGLIGNSGILYVENNSDIEFKIDSENGPTFSYFELFNGAGSHLWFVNENGDMRVFGEAYLDGDVGVGTTSPSEKLDVEGNIHLTGDIKKDVSGGTMARATPIAYGFINTAGTVSSGSPNVSSTWSSANSRYEITIAGEGYYVYDYVTTVTPAGSNFAVATIDSQGGKLLVFIRNIAGALIQSNFQFVTYKP